MTDTLRTAIAAGYGLHLYIFCHTYQTEGFLYDSPCDTVDASSIRVSTLDRT